ncbi:MAG: N-acetylmuramidase domain-containing protein, partial [Anaerolineae bacterium]
ISRNNPGLEIITRLYDDRIQFAHPTPAEFAAKMIPVMKTLRPYCQKFQVVNEPNHSRGYEGWGSGDDDARSFNAWFLDVYRRLKDACPWASLGFPGLAAPDAAHRDRAWLTICRPAIEQADWLGVHCYWQTPPGQPSGYLSEDFGLNFKYYHRQYPDKTLEILECGNSNIHSRYPITDEAIAQEYVAWLQIVFKYNYVNSASFFILSSPDADNWEFFAWRTEENWEKPVVQWVGQMNRPDLVGGAGQPLTQIVPFTNQNLINAFHNVETKLGLPNWTLMNRAGISLGSLIQDREAIFNGPPIDQLPNLTAEEKELLKIELAVLAGGPIEGGRPPLPPPPGEAAEFLWQRPELVTVPLVPPASERLSLPANATAIQRRVVTTWNRYGWLLRLLAETLQLDPGAPVAVLAGDGDRRPFDSGGRLIIRFEAQTFFDVWGERNPQQFRRHFRFNAQKPWQEHFWRPEPGAAWINYHGSQNTEWQVFDFARGLDETAARLSIRMGLPKLMGFNYPLAGYQTVGQMFDAFKSSERHQLLGLFDFIGGRGGDSRQMQALQAQNFNAFAAWHYGNRYAARFANATHSAFQAFRSLKEV